MVATTQNASKSSRRDFVINVVLACFLLVSIPTAVYFPTHRYNFVELDDYAFVFQNSVVARGLTFDGLHYAFFTANQGNWTPVTTLSWMADVTLWGMNAGKLHLTNVFFHIVNTLLLYRVLWVYTKRPGRSFVVALLFSIHPIHVESVAWISERRDVLFLFWVLVSLLCYQRYVQGRSLAWYLATTIAFLMALLSKSMAVTLPVLLLCLDFWPLQRWISSLDTPFWKSPKWIGLVVEKLPWFLFSFLTGIVTVIAQTEAGATTFNNSFPLIVKLGNAANSLVWYVQKAIFPTDLCVMYVHPGLDIDYTAVLLSGIILSGISLYVILNNSKRPYLLMGWTWFVVSLLPVLGILQVGVQARADRYAYLPQIGLGIMFVWLVADLIRRLPFSRCLAAGMTIGFAAFLTNLVIPQVRTWQNSFTLWQRAALVDPSNMFSVSQYGIMTLRLANDLENAEILFKRVMKIRPDYANTYCYLGEIYERKGRTKDAIDKLKETLELDPNHFDAMKRLGIIYQKQGDIDRASEILTKAVQVNQTDETVLNRLGYLHITRGEVEPAAKLFQQAVDVAPNDLMSRVNYGMALYNLHRHQEAIVQLRKALEIDPKNETAQTYLNTILEQSKVP